jgi:hypothetical protein
LPDDGVVNAHGTGRAHRQCRGRWIYIADPVNGKSPGSWSTEEVPGRTHRQCRGRWVYIVEPTNRKNRKSYVRWKPEEDAKLMEAVNKHDKKWVAVAAMFPDRTNAQCCERWVNNLDPDRASKTVE